MLKPVLEEEVVMVLVMIVVGAFSNISEEYQHQLIVIIFPHIVHEPRYQTNQTFEEIQ